MKTEEILAQFGASWVTLAGSLFGAIVSMRFLQGSSGMKVLLACGGFLAAVFVTPILTDWLGVVKPTVLGGASFVVGLYGMAIASEINTFIKSGFIQTWIKSFLERKAG